MTQPWRTKKAELAGHVIAPGAMLGSTGGLKEHEPRLKPLYMLRRVPVVGTLAPGVVSVSRWIELSARTWPTMENAKSDTTRAKTIFLNLFPSSHSLNFQAGF